MLLRIAMSTVMVLALPALAEQKNPPPKSAKKTAPKKAESTSAKPTPVEPAKPATSAHQEPPRVVYTPNAKPQLPEGAVEVETGLWRHVDKDNRTWFYRRTPFGVAKFEGSQTPVTAADEADGVIAREKGEMVEFERKTPFGVSKWTKKKGELNASEQTALERSLKTASKEQE